MADASPRSDRYKWWLLVFLFVTFFLEQGTRQIYNATLPQIKLSFLANGVSDTGMGLVGSVFASVFGFSLIGSGFAADFIGRKRVIVFGTLLFSLAILGCGFAAGIGFMIVMYGVLNAIGQCCVAPPCYSLISQYHDTTTRSTAMGIFQSAVYIGLIASSVFAGALAGMRGDGWRWAFWIMGGLGVVWAIVMQLFMRNTPQVKVAGGEEKVSVKAACLALFKKPTAILIALAFGMFMYASFGTKIWLTAYMFREFGGTEGVTIASAALHSVFWMCGGALLGMFVTARLIDRFGRNRPSIRLEVSALGFLLCAGPMIWVGMAKSFLSCCAALAALGIAQGVYEASHYPAMFDCVEPRYRSATTGLTGCMAFLIGSFAPVVLGWMSEHLSMRVGLMSIGIFYLLGAVILLPAIIWFFKKDWIGNALPDHG